MTSLASRLNDLAAAHAQQLITDDDYRLLRQDLFQTYSNEQLSLPQPPLPQPSQPQTPSDLPLRRKLSVVSGFSGFFFRAIGRSPKKHLPMSQNVVTHHKIQQRPSFLSLRRSEQQQHRQKQQQLLSSAPHDSDSNPAVLMALITSTEAEYTRLLDAFTSLESSTLKRIQYKTARRLYTPTPTSINVLFEGREWRKHTEPVPSIVLPPLSSVPIINHRHHHSRAHSQHQPSFLSTSSSVADQSSIHSAASSSKISISRSFPSPSHNANFAVPLPSSSLSIRAHAHPLQRQNSVSSASTQSTGANSHPQTPGPKSVGNLHHLTSLADRKFSAGIRADHIAEEDGPLDDTDDDPEAADYESAMRELNDIRRRKEDVNARFVRRMDYLKAQLRAAELREHVMQR